METVINNIDALNQGRILAQVPAVSNIVPTHVGAALSAVRRHPVRLLRLARNR